VARELDAIIARRGVQPLICVSDMCSVKSGAAKSTPDRNYYPYCVMSA
jgi:hypothetical protein